MPKTSPARATKAAPKGRRRRVPGGKSGRQLTYNAATHDRIVTALKAGASLRDAVAFAGVEKETFRLWLKAGRISVENPRAKGADGRFAQLARDVDQAVAESDVALVGIMRRAAEGTKAKDGQPARPGDWKAAEALLKFRAESRLRQAHLRKLKAEAKMAEMRVDGSLPAEKHDVTASVSAIDARHELATLLARAAPRPAVGDAAGDRSAASSGGSPADPP